VIQRFFLDRIDAESAGTSVGRQHDLLVLAGPHEAKSTLAFVQFAKPRANVALHAVIVELVPVFCRED
jgi:hypothetical protein